MILEDGAYVYDAAANVLRAAVPGDLRAQTGSQDFVGVAPLDLVYVADLAKLAEASPEDRIVLFGRGRRVHRRERLSVLRFGGTGHRRARKRGSRALGVALKLPAEKRVILAQTVGYPAAPAKP